MKKMTAILLVSFTLLQCVGCKLVPAVLMGTAAYLLNYSAKEEAAEKAEENEKQETLSMPDVGSETVPGEVKFSDISYSRPDTQLVRDAILELTGKLEDGNSADENLVEQFQKIVDMYNTVDTQSAIAYVLYSMDVTDSYYQDEYKYLEGERNEIDLYLTELAVKMFECEETGDTMRAEYGEEYEKNVYAKQKRNSPEIQEDIKADLALSSDYDTVLTTFAMQDGDMSYTMDELLNMKVETSEDYENYSRIIGMYYDQLNQKGGEIFLQLVQIRNRIAEKLGYANYSEYCYEDYARDYSTEDIKKIQDAVKEYIVPIYQKYYLMYYYFSGNYEKTQGIKSDYATFMNKFQTKLGQFSPEMKDAFDAMIRNELLSTNVSEKKMETSYTTYFYDYKEPYIFTQWEDTTSSPQTLIHEFGHFSNYFINQVYDWNVNDPLDLAEVDSQGFELLMMRDYEYFFGASKADAFRMEKILDAMYSLVSGCMEDEFQQIIYANPDMTLDEMNDCYFEIAQEYGFDTLFEYKGKEWTAIPHTFQSPLYYISYATSMIAALEIWEESMADYVAAKEDYLTIQHRPGNTEMRKLIMDCGLSDPISADTIQHLSETISMEFDRLL